MGLRITSNDRSELRKFKVNNLVAGKACAAREREESWQEGQLVHPKSRVSAEIFVCALIFFA